MAFMSQPTSAPEPMNRDRRLITLHLGTVRVLSISMVAIGAVGILAGLIAIGVHLPAAQTRGIPGTTLVGGAGLLGLCLHPRDLFATTSDVADDAIVSLMARCSGLLLVVATVFGVMSLITG